MEEWRDIPGWEDRYQVSDKGNVRSKKRKIIQHGSERTVGGNIIAQNPNQGGRLLVNLWIGKEIHRMQAHRLVLFAFEGPCPKGMECCHNNGDHTDNRRENLRWDTPSNNQMDRVLHGTSNRGERCGTHKLKEAEVQLIRRLLKAEILSQYKIAKMFKVSRSTIEMIKHKKRWGYLKEK